MKEKYYHYAANGKHFVLTEKGYEKTPDDVKKERKVGEPVKGFEYKVPVTWSENGWVDEVNK